MAVYTVHQPPLKKNDAAPNPEQFVFVRDGFSLWAFLFGPLWMLRHRMWLVLLGLVVIVAVALAALSFVNLTADGLGFVVFLLALLIGMEAGTLRRFTLGRRRWSNVGTVVGSDHETVERRFFDAWVRGDTADLTTAATPYASLPPPPHNPRPSPEVIGLFPQPGAQR